MGTCNSVPERTDAPSRTGITVRAAGDRSAARSRYPVSKIVLLGESASGKTSLVQRFTRNHWDPDSCATIGAAFNTHVIDLSDGRTLQMDIWDTAGQERYKTLAPLYYRNALGAVIVYDLTSAASFKSCASWVLDFKEQREGASLILVGNKMDLEAKREVPQSAAAEFAREHGMLYMETSAKENLCVSDMFELLASTVLDRMGPVSP